MKIGILIPTYNRKQHLAQAIDSALLQTHQDIELIIIDDSSSDGTGQLVAGYSDPRMRYVYNAHNAGLIENINKGIPMFSDEVHWCMILCDDDLLEKDSIHKLAIALSTTGAKSVIRAHLIFIDNQGEKIRDAYLSPPEETALDYISLRSRSQRETYLTGVLFNRGVFQKINGYPAFLSGLAADDAFIFALALRDRLVFERGAIAYIRIHEEAESRLSSDGIRKLKTIEQFADYCKRVAKESGTFDLQQLREFETVLRTYLRALNSLWWIRTVHYALTRDSKDREQLADLFSLMKSNPDNFTFRVKFAVSFYTRTGFFLENFAVYRACWAFFIKCMLFVKRAAVTK